jgi:hypothetical protein
MKVCLRQYSGKGAAELIDLLEQKSDEVKSLIGPIKGLVSYGIARTANGGFTVTVCEDQDGIDESIKKAKEWIAANAADIGADPPEVMTGDVVLRIAQASMAAH